MKRSGIYQIRHIDTGRVYVGSGVSIDTRFYYHRCSLKHGRHYNKRLQSAWTEHGEGAFAFEVIELVPDHADLVTREQHWIDTLHACRKGYGFNILPRAYSILGTKRSDETKAKLSAAWTERKVSAETCAKISAAKKGTRLSPEHRAKIGVSSKGHVVSAEARAKIGAASALRRYGPLKENRRKAISQRHRGEGNWAAKLTEDNVREIRDRLAGGTETGSEIGRSYGVTKLAISKIKCGRTWTHVV